MSDKLQEIRERLERAKNGCDGKLSDAGQDVEYLLRQLGSAESRLLLAEKLAESAKKLCKEYRHRVPGIMSSDATWAPVIEAESALSAWEGKK
jgi:outer membrane protein TolC